MSVHGRFGAETGAILQEGWGITGDNAVVSILNGAPTIESNLAKVRSGLYSFKIDASGGTAQQIRFKGPNTAGQEKYLSFWVMFDSLNSGGAVVRLLTNPGIYQIVLNASNQLELQRTVGNAIVGSPSAALQTGVWYNIELDILVAAGSSDDGGELRLDGAVVASESAQTVATAGSNNHDIGAGFISAGTGPVYYLDDVKFNDDQGAVENGVPNRESRIVLLRPTGDIAVGANWMQPQTTGDDLTDLWEALGWPADGAAFSDVDANNLKYIFNNVASVTNYVAECESYEDAGVPPGSTILNVWAVARLGSDNTTNTTGAIAMVENPDQINGMVDPGAETALFNTNSFDANNVVAGTEPTGWWAARGAFLTAPPIDGLDLPVHVRIGKRTSTTRAAMVAAIGAMAEYLPPADAGIIAVESGGVFGDIPVAVKEGGTFQDVPIGVYSGGSWS